MDIVFECIIEKLETKQEFFSRMDALFPPETVLASNTSAISITEIGATARHRERILGTHFWDPPYIIPLVDVIRTEHTAQWALDRVFELLKAANKKRSSSKKTCRDSWPTGCSTPCSVKRCPLWRRASPARRMWTIPSNTVSACASASPRPSR